MAKEAPAGAASKIPQSAKIAGGVVLTVASIALFIHRMPKRDYVAVHEDKPRPKVEAAVQVPKPAPAAPAVAKAAAPAPAPAKPGAKPVVQVPATPPVIIPVAVQTDDEWLDACRPEIGVLCHKLATKRVRRCLGKYDDVLLAPCREALEKRSPANKSVATTGF